MKIRSETRAKKPLKAVESIFEPREEDTIPWGANLTYSVKVKRSHKDLHTIQKPTKMKRSNASKEPKMILKNLTVNSFKALGNFFRPSKKIGRQQIISLEGKQITGLSDSPKLVAYTSKSNLAIPKPTPTPTATPLESNQPKRSKIRTTYSTNSNWTYTPCSVTPGQPSMGVAMVTQREKRIIDNRWQNKYIERSEEMINKNTDLTLVTPFLDSLNFENLPVPIVNSTFMVSDDKCLAGGGRGIILDELTSPISTKSRLRYANVTRKLPSDTYQSF